MDMKILLVEINRTAGKYTVTTEDNFFFGQGDSLEHARKALEKQIRLFVRSAKREGFSYDKNLDGNYELRYKFDVRRLLLFYEGIISHTALERLTGINKKQFWSYANGHSRPRLAQVEKIEKALHKLGEELINISLI